MGRAYTRIRDHGSLGLTLLETALAALILSVIMMVTFGAFRNGLFAWKRSTSQSQLLQELNTISARLTSWLERSTASSLTVLPDGTAMSGLDSTKEDGSVDFGPKGEVLWQRYHVVYLTPQRELLFRDLLLTTTAPQRTVPGPLESYDPGTGPQPLSFYLNGGSKLAQHIVQCRFQVSGRRVDVQLTAEHARFRSATPERVQLATSVLTRNH